MNKKRKTAVFATAAVLGFFLSVGSTAEIKHINVQGHCLAKAGVNVLVGDVEDFASASSSEEKDEPEDTFSMVINTFRAGEDGTGQDNTENDAGSSDIEDTDTVSDAVYPSPYESDKSSQLPDVPEDVVSVPDAVLPEDGIRLPDAVPQEDRAGYTDGISENDIDSSVENVSDITGETKMIRLGFAGDINLDEEWATTKFMDEQGGIEKVFSENLLELMQGFDIFMLNNEFTYSTRGSETDKSYHFRADPSRVDNLKKLGVDIVLLANNHVFDYGEDALLDTLDTLEEAGIPYVGAGRDLEEAGKPYIFEINGRRIAYVAASSAEEYTESIATRAATEDESGIFACYDQDPFIAVIRKAAAEADFVIANVHWGMEYESQYYDEQREFAEDMIKAGADAVIGTHTHCLQGVNYIDGKPVFYSLGNYWFNELKLDTGIAELTLEVPSDPEKEVKLISTRFYPAVQKNFTTKMPVNSVLRERILRYLEDISDDSVSIDKDGYIHPAG